MQYIKFVHERQWIMIGNNQESLNQVGLKQYFEGRGGRLVECKLGLSSWAN